MSSSAVFVVGVLVTLVVVAAFGILAYGITLDRRDLIAADQDRLGVNPAEAQAPVPPVAERRGPAELVLK